MEFRSRLTVLCLAWVVAVAAPVAVRAADAKEDKKEKPFTERTSDEELYRSSVLFGHVLEQIRQNYVDESKVDYEKLTYSALRGMLSELDPHSQFMDPSMYGEMRDDTEGQFGGLGITVGTNDGILTVHMPIEGGPGAKAGMLPGDRIVKIGDKATKGMPLSDAVKMLRGQPGSEIMITIYRPSTKEFKEYSLIREIINVPTVRDVALLNDPETKGSKIGYLRITQFGDKTAKEFEDALAKLQKEGMEALVLDLRNNPGGLIDSAVSVAGKFLPARTVVVSTEGRAGESSRMFYYSSDTRPILNLPMVVLINGNSASGSEIVAGALKDLRRAILVGETTFGKGSVQTVQPVDRTVSPPPALRLTTAKYYTPSRKVIHEYGVEPDISAPVSLEEEQAVYLLRSQASLNAKEREELEKHKDSQLTRAILVLRGLLAFNSRDDEELIRQAKR